MLVGKCQADDIDLFKRGHNGGLDLVLTFESGLLMGDVVGLEGGEGLLELAAFVDGVVGAVDEVDVGGLEAGDCRRIFKGEVGGDGTAPEEEAKGRDVSGGEPAAGGGHALGEAEDGDGRRGGVELGCDGVVDGVEVVEVVGDVVLAVLFGHPGGADGAGAAMEVEAVKGFGGDDEGVVVQEDVEVLDECGGQLTVAVDDVPEFLNVWAGGTEIIVAGGFRNLDEVCLRHKEIVTH